MGYKAKHAGNNKKLVTLAISLLLLICFSVGGTLAYLITSTDPVENQFTPSKVEINVEEELDGDTKNNVTIKNTGDTTAYIRATVVVTWQDANGNAYGMQPVAGADNDYTISWTKDGWVLGNDGYYYHTTAVLPNGFTGELFTACQPIDGKAPAGYDLHVEILAQAIQSTPTNAVVDAWGVTVADDGTISK